MRLEFRPPDEPTANRQSSLASFGHTRLRINISRRLPCEAEHDSDALGRFVTGTEPCYTSLEASLNETIGRTSHGRRLHGRRLGGPRKRARIQSAGAGRYRGNSRPALPLSRIYQRGE